ncbi:helix-turn-helix domain-containing protein [Haloarculaceae archaeon H-GB11]|nr:helix-turn-helix domain-containing protein [Haloarculaceae archaeon H-GB11]
MITARLAVRHDGGWAADLGDCNCDGEFLTYTYRNNRSYGLVAFQSDRIDTVLDRVRSHDTVEEFHVIERDGTDDGWETAMVYLVTSYREIPPMEMLIYEGYFPIGNPSVENGLFKVDLLLEDKEELELAIDLLDAYGRVTVEYLSDELRYQTIPTQDDFEALAADISPRQLAVLGLAVERGYFEDPREVTLAELAAELDITKATASLHLRRARLKVVSFLAAHMDGPRRAVHSAE